MFPYSESQHKADQLDRDGYWDVVFGALLPLACLYFDPIVFRSRFGSFGSLSLMNGLQLSEYRIGSYLAIGISIIALLLSIMVPRTSLWLIGVLAGSTLFSLILGIIIFPTAMFAIIMVIGLFGLVPLLTAFVYWKRTVLEYRRSRLSKCNITIMFWSILGFALYFAIPITVDRYMHSASMRAMHLILSDDPKEAGDAMAFLKRFQAILSFDEIVFMYRSEKDDARGEQLANAYKRLTGTEIQSKARRMYD